MSHEYIQSIENPAKWNKMLKLGGFMAFAVVFLIPIQIYVFIAFPPPTNALDFLILFKTNWFLGLLNLDLLYTISNILLIFVYLGLFAALRNADFSLMIIAVTTGLIGIASYFASTIAVEMLILSKQFAIAQNIDVQNQILAASINLLVSYKGTAFVVYYILNGITLLIISAVMYNDKNFTRTTAIFGLISGLLMLIPSTFGTIGLIFSLASLIPWIVFSVLFAKRLLKLSKLQSN